MFYGKQLYEYDLPPHALPYDPLGRFVGSS